MAMELVKVAEILPDYVNFFLDFCRRPVQAVTEATPPNADLTAAVSGKLIGYAVLSTGLSYIIVLIGRSVGMADDGSAIVAMAERIEWQWLPAAALVCIFLAAVVIHVLLLVGALLARLIEGLSFKGGIKETVNATLAFSVWCLPVFTLVIVITRVLARGERLPPLALLLFVLPFVLAFWVYFGAAFMGAHRLPRAHITTVFAFAATVVVLVQKIFD